MFFFFLSSPGSVHPPEGTRESGKERGRAGREVETSDARGFERTEASESQRLGLSFISKGVSKGSEQEEGETYV